MGSLPKTNCFTLAYPRNKKGKASDVSGADMTCRAPETASLRIYFRYFAVAY